MCPTFFDVVRCTVAGQLRRRKAVLHQTIFTHLPSVDILVGVLRAVEGQVEWRLQWVKCLTVFRGQGAGLFSPVVPVCPGRDLSV